MTTAELSTLSMTGLLAMDRQIAHNREVFVDEPQMRRYLIGQRKAVRTEIDRRKAAPSN
jgi:hypothetical protein